MAAEMLKAVVLAAVSLAMPGDEQAVQLAEEELARARHVIAAFRDGRERLESATFEASGRFTWVSEARKIDFETAVKIFCAFDYSQGLFRFDRDENCLSARGIRNQYRRYARSPQQVLRRWGGSEVRNETIEILRPDSPALAGPDPSGARAFNPRAVGCVNSGEFGIYTPLERIYGDKGFLNDRQLVEAVEERPGLCRVSWEFGPLNGVRRTIWFDEAKGHSPVRIEERYRDHKGQRWWEPSDIGEVTWKEQDGVWVPDSCLLEQRRGHHSAAGVAHDVRRYALSFDWHRINQEVSPRDFSVEGLESGDKPVTVVDQTLGRGVIVKHPLVQDPSRIRPSKPATPAP